MSKVREWIHWRPSQVVISLFAAFPRGGMPSQGPVELVGAEGVSALQMNDDFGVLQGLDVMNWDLTFPTVPEPLEDNLRAWLRWALENGAKVAWFGTEGTFSFDYLLSQVLGRHNYGVGRQPDRIELESEHSDQEWREILGGAQAELLVDSEISRLGVSLEGELIASTLLARLVVLATLLVSGQEVADDDVGVLVDLWQDWHEGRDCESADVDRFSAGNRFVSRLHLHEDRVDAAERLLHELPVSWVSQ
ncbi:MAG: hypothetical protein R3B07_20120 [Polyangiaceae bacterium]